jgi:hypothetical protein
MQWTMLRNTLLATVVVVIFAIPASSGSHGAGVSDRAMELIGAVFNTGSSSAQYGYISSINGIAGIFAGSPQNETTALLTFYNDTNTLRVINNGPLRIVNREGRMTVYIDEKPNGDFANPDSFRDGTPVMVATLRHQVILDTVTNQFTTVFVNTIESSPGFTIAGRHYDLGQPGQMFRTTVFGRPSTSGPGQFAIAGYTAGMDARSRSAQGPN